MAELYGAPDGRTDVRSRVPVIVSRLCHRPAHIGYGIGAGVARYGTPADSRDRRFGAPGAVGKVG